MTPNGSLEACCGANEFGEIGGYGDDLCLRLVGPTASRQSGRGMCSARFLPVTVMPETAGRVCTTMAIRFAHTTTHSSW